MPAYKIQRLVGVQQNEDIETFEISHFYRDEQYKPVTKGQLTLHEGRGMELVMWCYESNPRAIYHNPNDPVHTDSCLEGFINFYPELQSLGYLSVEMNANGASHCSFGTGRHTRSFILNRDLPHPEVKVEKLLIDNQEVWCARALIRLSLIKSLYGRCDFPSEHLMRANFFKCGNHTDMPHWGSWSLIKHLDFHSPEYFGDLIIN